MIIQYFNYYFKYYLFILLYSFALSKVFKGGGGGVEILPYKII